MSERILKALMQLFAIIARVDENIESQEPVTSGEGRKIVESFLSQELSHAAVEEYLKIFDEFLISFQGGSKKKDGKRKKTSVHSVKVLRICTQINEELAQRQKIIVLVRILEFINANEVVDAQELEFAQTVADTFNVSMEEYNIIKDFVEAPIDRIIDNEDMLYVTANPKEDFKQAKHIYSEGIEGQIRVLKITSVNFHFFKYLGTSELNLNGQPLLEGRHVILNQGSSIRSSKVQPIYYSDIIGAFLSDTSAAKIVFKAENVVYKFKSGKIGLQTFNFAEESGSLLGIMGGSGAGKSTLLNVLNGNYTPAEGQVTINGVDIHREKNKIEGVIGYVSQDDLLIEELTVFQNLFYNAKLCFGGMDDKLIAKRVLKTLSSLGLYETKDLKVGSPLEKTISGGQRKRLNIALELIREPSVLFVDEPTSGLSSRDSENIMDLLKELALKGKLIFVVIHQPSSDIFKMFDKLLILDVGGFPIYNGNPVDGVMYFKKCINHVKSDESECPVCGNVNPEQIFNIIESKVVDEYGNQTQHRKISPKEWNKSYLEELEPEPDKTENVLEIPESTFKKPGFLKQLRVFFIRDVLSKLTNRQYMLINLLEAPLLAFVLAFFVRFYNIQDGVEYTFRDNQNIPQFIFISVIVALFIGLTVAAEEIIKDQKILKRESFLNLSKGSYLTAKISIMFIISAIQMAFFVLIGNLVLEIYGMWWQYWLILFSLSCFANLLGLNISASFNSVKVIYILIPILIIPQLLFSGVIVKFDKLNPMFGNESSVPLIGNVMASRWAYEAMAVSQFKDNKYGEIFFDVEKKESFASWKKVTWLAEMKNQEGFMKMNLGDFSKVAKTVEAHTILKNEIEREENFIKNLTCNECVDDIKLEELFPELYGENSQVKTYTFPKYYTKYELENGYITGIKKPDQEGFSSDALNGQKWGPGENDQNLFDVQTKSNVLYISQMNFDSKEKKDEFLERVSDTKDGLSSFYTATDKYFDILSQHYENVRKKNKDLKNAKTKQIVDNYGIERYQSLVNDYTNDALEQFVRNKAELSSVVVSNGYLVQKSDPIYLDPYDQHFWNAHFYAPRKRIAMLNTYVPTYWANIGVMWLMTIMLIITLRIDFFKKLMDWFPKFGAWLKEKFKKSEE
ncbi:ATP-binding cassette domain-containing protein [Paracrocinitomix mangrovi]|uniref:ATP-binding cassette domain-containing protein n=1 Tax=Paracrocinitomix mangrovi TaxID=2862509 RepID=UPI001C8EE693|nr:ATP-binding cassette domain-containing protein [Paracrocinitomix mangrovi]UKN02824.1 ATP-binding cassette domain-containing protein [Paracrocinitomix mangrovi]